jgi:hypothetical protein
VSQDPNADRNSSCDQDRELLAECRSLWAEADELWDQLRDTPAFHGYVSADYEAVWESLARLRGSVLTFLEWGSGLGVVTMMASRMGFEAYGIEAEPILVEYSEDLARTYGPNARFAQGSFIPDGFEWNPAEGDNVIRTVIDTASAYDELDMELLDFDLVYAYPWPDELTLYHNIMRKFGRRESLFLSYDAREGIELVRVHDQ